MEIKVPMIDVAAYLADRPGLLVAFVAFLTASSVQDAWAALQRVKELDK